jgi:hypothetical protein
MKKKKKKKRPNTDESGIVAAGQGKNNTIFPEPYSWG